MPDFPIIVTQGDVNSELYGITGAFVHYVNELMRRGLQGKDLPDMFFDLYALDYYYWQVCNGGHSQFVANSGGLLDTNLSHAMRGAAMIGMPELTQLLSDCRIWCDAHPDERDRQDGSACRAHALEALDDCFFLPEFQEYDDAAYASFVASHPLAVQDWIDKATWQTKSRSRNKYVLRSGVWLICHPDIRMASGSTTQTEVDEILRKYSRLPRRIGRLFRNVPIGGGRR